MMRTLRLGLVALAVWFLALEVRAADEGLVLRMRAEQLASEGQCTEAITTARRARELDPDDAVAAFVEGRCALNLQRYEEAISALEQAQRLSPGLEGLAIDLTAARYHHGDLAAAEASLSVAEGQSPDDPRVSLYRGLLLMERAQDAEAATAFERAREMNPRMTPVASYYEGLAWERARDRERAREALRRVKDDAPSSAWATEAGNALDRLDEREAAEAPNFWATVSVGGEWDDNVVIRGDGVTLPDNISDQEDGRAIWFGEAGAELLRTEKWAGGVIAGYYGNAHFDLHQFDTQYPSLSVWLDRRIDEKSFVRLQPYAGYAWLETDPYLGHVGGTVSYHRDFEDAGNGRLYARGGYRDYLFNIRNAVVDGEDYTRERDRDGFAFRTGYDHGLGVTDTTDLRGGIVYGFYEAEGDDFSFQGIGGHLGIRQALPFEVTFDAEARYSYDWYRRASSFNTPPQGGASRRDNLWSTRVALERPITDWMSVTAHWRYFDSDSNTDAYDYDRHILGGYFTVSYGP